jgi:hypothetical protein
LEIFKYDDIEVIRKDVPWSCEHGGAVSGGSGGGRREHSETYPSTYLGTWEFAK